MTTCAPTPKRLALYTGFVGASLLAKAIVQTPCFLCLHWPIREQARSHRTDALRGRHTGVVDDDMRPHAEALGVVHRLCGSDALRGRHTDIFDEDMRPTPKRLALCTGFVEASLLAKAIVQTPCFLWLHWPIREQARSHRTDVLRGRHAAVFDDDMRAHAEALGVVHRSCGSNKHKAWGRDLGIFKRTAS
ncbi:hypothetical protein BKM12_08055 [Pseudomonas syringae pv. syringae]|nr:hypothetical protein BKM12_08055 [Pseudomonas syringae pv. syringae]